MNKNECCCCSQGNYYSKMMENLEIGGKEFDVLFKVIIIFLNHRFTLYD